jgi:hypothetical protein
MRLPEGLPELTGRWLGAYKLLWWAMFAVSLIAVTAGQWRHVQESLSIELRLYGAGLLPNEESDELTFSPLSPAARAAGIVPESVLVAVDGRAVPTEPSDRNIEYVAEQLDGRDGRALTLSMRAPDGTVTDARIVRGPEHLAAADREAPVTHDQRAFISLASNSLDALIVMAGAILLFWRRPSDSVAALLSLGLLAVPANDVAVFVSSPALRRTLDNGLDVVPMACILLGMTVFPSGRFIPRWTLLIVPAIVAWGLFLMFGESNTSLVLQLAVILPGLVITVGSLAWRYVRTEPGTPRQQVKWVMLGFAAFFASGMVEFALLFIAGASTDNWTHFALTVADNVLGALQGFFIVGGLLVSLLRYRLYDADAAISRSAVYAGLTVVLFAVFAASETLIQALGQEWFGASTGAAGGAIAAGLAALLLVPLHHRLSDWAKKRFQRDLTRLRAELPEVLVAIRDSNDPNALADDALRLAMRGVHASRGAILLADEGRLVVAHAEGIPSQGLAERLAGELPAAPSRGVMRIGDPELPISLPLITPAGATAGWLALGPHPDGSLYGKDDRKALEELAAPLARALSLAIERSRREHEREAERRTLVERLAQLEQTLAQVAALNAPPREAGAA